METVVLDLSPLTLELVKLAFAALLAALTVGARVLYTTLKEKWGLEVEQAQRDKVNEAIQFALQYAETKVASAVDAKDNVEVKNQMVATAAEYVMAKIPDALDRLGVTPESVADLVEARIERYLAK